jgi:hypothetical protein
MVMVFSDADIDKAVKSLPITIKVVRGWKHDCLG